MKKPEIGDEASMIEARSTWKATMKKFGVKRRITDAVMRRTSSLQRVNQAPKHGEQLLSDSQLTAYEQEVRKVLKSNSKWRNFRSRFHYRIVLEHVDPIQGRAYLNKVKTINPNLLELIDSIKENDKIGNPAVYEYDETGPISPTTLRYLAVAAELEVNLSKLKKAQIAEIGIGYGGQIRIIDLLYDVQQYVGFDLPEVQELTRRYLNQFKVKSTTAFPDIHSFTPKRFDLVISNYAFSELPYELQRIYLDKVLKFSWHGYLTMNSGNDGISTRSFGKIALPELRRELPGMRVIPENPLTGAGNYLIIW